MCTDFLGFSKPLFNSQPVNVQKHKRCVIVNCAAIPQNLTENFYPLASVFLINFIYFEEKTMLYYIKAVLRISMFCTMM